MKDIRFSREQLPKVKQTVQDFIRDRVALARCTGAVMGLSGGVDSSVVATLAAEVVDLRGLVMPQKGVNPSSDQADAEKLAKRLGIPYDVVEIDPIVRAVESAASFTAPEERRKVAWANLKPRVRMVLNYYRANMDNRMVLGTGNKTECLLGYYTKYGDGGVDVLPIADLYKTQVWQLAEYLGVDPAVVKKPPSAGLWPGQTDEGEIGATYEQMDQVLYHTVDLGMSPAAAAKELGYSRDLVERLHGRITQHAHKSQPPAVCSVAGVWKPKK